jgi:hypothetical protein
MNPLFIAIHYSSIPEMWVLAIILYSDHAVALLI